MRKKFIIPFVAAVLFGAAGFTTVVKSDFFEIAKQLEIFTSLYKELNMNYVGYRDLSRFGIHSIHV